MASIVFFNDLNTCVLKPNHMFSCMFVKLFSMFMVEHVTVAPWTMRHHMIFESLIIIFLFLYEFML